jgi:phospholipase/lecithinase/hemolysin
MKTSASNSLTFLKEKLVSRTFRTVALSICLLDIVGGSANAYLDPGMGSQALQVGIAGILGLVFTFRSSISRLVTTFRRKDRS